jgi:hypothetical protein
MLALIEFLLARIAEDQAVLTVLGDRFGLGDRWVTECEARRRIVELIAAGADDIDSRERWEVLQILAQPYVDHPDLRAAWQLRRDDGE